MQRSLSTSLLAVLAILAAFAATPADARVAYLDMIPLGDTSAEGRVAIARTSNAEALQVRVIDRLMRDGAVLTVWAVIDGDPLPIGRIRMALGAGLLEIDSKMSLSAAFPLRSIEELYVVKGRDTRILFVDF